MPGPLVSEGDGTCHCGQRRSGTFTREPIAPVDDTFAASEGHVSPYAHSATLTDALGAARAATPLFVVRSGGGRVRRAPSGLCAGGGALGAGTRARPASAGPR